MRLAIIGLGRWGQNVLREASQLVDVAYLCDEDNNAVVNAFGPGSPPVASKRCFHGVDDLCERDDFDAAWVATPADTHCEIALKLLKAGKHVLVEKPMALNWADMLVMRSAAEAEKRVLMVGHVMLYNPGFKRLRELVVPASQIEAIVTRQIARGRFREEGALWSLAPHDVSMVLALAGEHSSARFASGAVLKFEGVVSHAHLDLDVQAHENAADSCAYFTASCQVSWLSPSKSREVTVVTRDKIFNWDEALVPEILVWPRKPGALNPGDMVIGPHDPVETFGYKPKPSALVAECMEFVSRIEHNETGVSHIDFQTCSAIARCAGEQVNHVF